MGNEILYLCNRKKCKKCNCDCGHTRDIKFAKNFEKEEDCYIEKETIPVVIRVSHKLQKEELEEIIVQIEEEISKRGWGK